MLKAKQFRSVLNCLQFGCEVPDTFVFDGCSCAPDHVGCVDLRPACCIHDWEYTRGGSESYRRDADKRFRANLIFCFLHVHQVPVPWYDWLRCVIVSTYLPGIYYRRVRFFGCTHFQYAPGRRPNIRWLRFRVFFTRYLT